jgi:hypothetical protein
MREITGIEVTEVAMASTSRVEVCWPRTPVMRASGMRPRNPEAENKGETGHVRNRDQQNRGGPIFLGEQASSLRTGTKHEQNQAKLVQKSKNRVGARRETEEPGVDTGHEKFEYKWPKDDSGQNFTDNSRLFQTFGEVAEAMNGGQKCSDRKDELPEVGG